ncbi:MAG TPA: flagellar motor switch protein FliN [Baekduia sp.]|uniref:flagellar motor switch protein FliN n=1 Tax=Baekduia sp. TaxID=2600305 RepID=UPI002D77F3B5|nr:flagellar motor switch protein FliN [Baekduia sp.]HET6508881.1 flagellar motor switch protein FliN [Baekduia sp.]
MTDVEFTPLDDGTPGGLPLGEADLSRLTDVTVELTVEVGRTHMSLGETMSLGQGSVVTLDRLADKPVDLLVNGRPIARGEVVVIDEQFGLRITEVNGAERKPAAEPAAFEPATAELPPGDGLPPGLPEAA